jgi:hypothetical protein
MTHAASWPDMASAGRCCAAETARPSRRSGLAAANTARRGVPNCVASSSISQYTRAESTCRAPLPQALRRGQARRPLRSAASHVPGSWRSRGDGAVGPPRGCSGTRVGPARESAKALTQRAVTCAAERGSRGTGLWIAAVGRKSRCATARPSGIMALLRDEAVAVRRHCCPGLAYHAREGRFTVDNRAGAYGARFIAGSDDALPGEAQPSAKAAATASASASPFGRRNRAPGANSKSSRRFKPDATACSIVARPKPSTYISRRNVARRQYAPRTIKKYSHPGLILSTLSLMA